MTTKDTTPKTVTFEKDGIKYETDIPTEQVQLRATGWKEATPKATSKQTDKQATNTKTTK